MSAVTVYGVCAVTFMMVMYALEPRGRGFVLAFAAGCLLSSAYGFLSAPGRSASSKRSGPRWRCAGSCGAPPPRPTSPADASVGDLVPRPARRRRATVAPDRASS